MALSDRNGDPTEFFNSLIDGLAGFARHKKRMTR
jgi:hypothetical protein